MMILKSSVYNFDNYTIIHLLLATIIKKGKLKGNNFVFFLTLITKFPRSFDKRKIPIKWQLSVAFKALKSRMCEKKAIITINISISFVRG